MKPRSKDDWIVMLDAIDAMLVFLRSASREQVDEFAKSLPRPRVEPSATEDEREWCKRGAIELRRVIPLLGENVARERLAEVATRLELISRRLTPVADAAGAVQP